MNPSLITSASRPVTMLVAGLLLLSLAGCLPRAAASTSSGQRPRALELSGSATQRLYPGGSAPLNVHLKNPSGYDVTVSRITVTPHRATTRDGRPNPACDGRANLTARQYTGPTPLRVRAKRTVLLAALDVPTARWPLLTMPNLATNQDACKGTTFRFDYAATATEVTR